MRTINQTNKPIHVSYLLLTLSPILVAMNEIRNPLPLKFVGIFKTIVPVSPSSVKVGGLFCGQYLSVDGNMENM